MEILKIENLTKVYGKGENEVHALNGVSFSVEKGEFVSIIGSSGSGKSTLLHLIGGVDRPTSGKVYVDGKDVYAQKEDALAIFRRRQVGLIYQFYNLIPVLNVEENITLPVLMDGRKVNEKRFEELIDILKMKERLHHLPNELSGGQQQRVGVARALVVDPKIIFADEPAGNLESHKSEEVMTLMQRVVREQKKTLVMVTHDNHLATYADRIFHIIDGKIVKIEDNRKKREDKEHENV